MEKIIDFKTYLDSIYSDILLKDTYFANEMLIQLFSDSENVIKLANERLRPQFLRNNSFQKLNNISLYSLYSKKAEQLIKNIFSKNKNYCWKKIKHMGGYYFHTNFLNKFSITIWPTEKHSKFRDENLSIDELISDYVNEHKNICVIIDNLKGNFLHLYNNMDEYIALTPLRLIRSFFLKTFLENNYIFFHAAAIKYKNKGILLTGESGSGKTSTLLNFLDTKNGSFIANDKVFIGPKGDSELEVWGWPAVVNLGMGSLGQYKQLQKFLTNIDDITCTQYGYKPQKEYLKISSEQIKSLSPQNNKLIISSKQLCNLFDKEITPYVKIDSIVNVNLKWDCQNKILRKLNSEEASIILKNNTIDNESDQLLWLGYPFLKNNQFNNPIIKDRINSINFYEYQSIFQDRNLTDFLNEIVM